MSYSQNPLSRRVAEVIDEVAVVPVIVVRELAHAVPLARALAAGGLTVLEITLRSEVALGAFEVFGRIDPRRERRRRQRHRDPVAGLQRAQLLQRLDPLQRRRRQRRFLTRRARACQRRRVDPGGPHRHRHAGAF